MSSEEKKPDLSYLERNAKLIKLIARDLMQYSDAMDKLGMTGAEHLRSRLCDIEQMAFVIESATKRAG